MLVDGSVVYPDGSVVRPIESNFEGTIRIKNRAIVRNSSGDLVCMTRKMAAAVVDQDGTECAVHRIQYGARMKVEEGDHIKRGQRIAEWDPYMRPILTEVDGTIGFEDLVEGQSMSESLDESTGIAKRVVIDWRTGVARGRQDLRPAIVIMGEDGKILKLARGRSARYLLTVDAILSVDPGGTVKPGDVIARMPRGRPGRKTAKARPAASTDVGKSVLKNAAEIDLFGASLVIQIDQRLELLRQERIRLNSDESRASVDRAISDWDDLKHKIESFLKAASQFAANKTADSAVKQKTVSLVDGIRDWLSKRHLQICDKAFDKALQVGDVGLFGAVLGMCLLAGAEPNLSVAIPAAWFGGKPVVEAIKACLKGHRS